MCCAAEDHKRPPPDRRPWALEDLRQALRALGRAEMALEGHETEGAVRAALEAAETARAALAGNIKRRPGYGHSPR